MKRSLLALLMTVLATGTLDAQRVYLSPLAGVYIPASDLYALRDEARQFSAEKEGAFAIGANVEIGIFRVSGAYASGAQINERGVQNRDNIAEGKLLALAGDIVLRPLPRLVVQPYLLIGAGVRREDYSPNEDGVSDALPEDQTKFAGHAGIGVDAMLGRIGIVAEVTDFITENQFGRYEQHDAFGFVGLRVRLF